MNTPATTRSIAQIRADEARRKRILDQELPTARRRAADYARGIGALLVAAVAFSLIKGRSELNALEPTYARAVGVLLASTVTAGVIAAASMFRAAYGPLVGISPATSDHAEARNSIAALRRGLAVAGIAATCLLAAVATTWYGPSADGPRLQLIDNNGNKYCGNITHSDTGEVTLEIDRQTVTVDLATAKDVRAVTTCGP